MKNFLILITVILFSVLLKAQIYVSPYGDDSNSGTIDKPFKTLSAAVTAAKEVTTIYLRGGVYSSSAKIKIPFTFFAFLSKN